MHYLWTINQIKSNIMVNIDRLIANELSSTLPDSLYLQALNKMKSGGLLTLEDFSETGRFVDRRTFESDNPTIQLHPECTDVIVYMCGFYIQSLKGSVFFISVKEDAQESDEIDRWTYTKDDLDDVEYVLWNSTANKFFNG